MALGDTTRSRFAVLGALYFAQGVPWGLFAFGLPLRLTQMGLGAAEIGYMMTFAWAPWVAKPLVGPLVDRASFGRLGRRRPLILAAEVGMALSLAALATVDPRAALAPFLAVVLAHNAFAAFQDVAVDALAMDLLPPPERGRANGVMSSGKFLGVLAGGPTMISASTVLGWGATYALTIALLLIPAGVVLVLRERPAGEARPRVVREAVRAFADHAALLGLAFALVYQTSPELLKPVTMPLFGKQLKFGAGEIAILSWIGSGAPVVGSLVGGMLADRLGRGKALAIGTVGAALGNLVFALTPGSWPALWYVGGYTAVTGVLVGIAYASTLALFMDLTDPRVAATQFQLFMGVSNLRGTGATFMGGVLGATIATPTLFGLSAVLDVLPLVLVVAIQRRRRATTP